MSTMQSLHIVAALFHNRIHAQAQATHCHLARQLSLDAPTSLSPIHISLQQLRLLQQPLQQRVVYPKHLAPLGWYAFGSHPPSIIGEVLNQLTKVDVLTHHPTLNEHNRCNSLTNHVDNCNCRLRIRMCTKTIPIAKRLLLQRLLEHLSKCLKKLLSYLFSKLVANVTLLMSKMVAGSFIIAYT